MKQIIQFGFSVHPVPDGVPIVDCRPLPNPHKEPDRVKQRWIVRTHPLFKHLVEQALQLLATHDKIGIGCAYGIHRSGMVAEEVERRFQGDVEIEKLNKGG